jgi:hypothetical protein
MKFIKNNSYNIIRLMLNQFGMMIFGLVLSFATGSLESGMSDKLLLFVSIFATGFYMVLIYNIMWEQGAKDIIRIEAGRMQCDRYYGAKVALVANIPNLILALLVLIGYITSKGSSGLYISTYIFSGFIQSTYLGIVKAFFSLFENPEITLLLKSFIYFFTVIPAILCSTLSYILGLKNVKLFGGKKKSK